MPKTVQVVPAILTDDAEALEKMVQQAETFTDFVQIDVMDGCFVPSTSIRYTDLATLQTKLRWEAHLMVLQPENQFLAFQQAGAEKVVFHYEAAARPQQVISQARNLGLGVGLAVNPETPVSDIVPLAGEVDSILFLTVHPGFYGAQFLPEVLDKIREFRDARPDAKIGVDGGIKAANIAEVAETGVDVIYVGSAIFLQPDPAEAFRHLLSLAKEGSLRRMR